MGKPLEKLQVLLCQFWRLIVLIVARSSGFMQVFKNMLCWNVGLLTILVHSIVGRGGASIYGKNFEDEIHEDLKHTGTKYFLIKMN